MNKDGIEVSGQFTLRTYIGGELVNEYIDNNLVVTLGQKNVAKLLGGDAAGKKVSKIQAGTSNAATDLANTTITNPFTKSISSVTYPANNQVLFNWVLEAGEANGMTIAEFGLLNDSSELFARKITTPFAKTSPMVIVGAWKITIN
jgi:hypothetical protein